MKNPNIGSENRPWSGSKPRLAILGAGLLLTACGWMVASAVETSAKPYDRAAARLKYKRPTKIPTPADNIHTPARVELGKALFFDPRLSASGITSCGSCHNPSFAWGDGLPRAVGHNMKTLGRRTPTILNVAYGELFFWDGRAASLEEQALGPIKAAGEMNLPLDQMLAKVKAVAGYTPMFEAAYPGEGITESTVAKAIANFERTVISAPAPFDAWVAGNEAAISETAKHGFDLFNTKAECYQCHSGWNFTDDGFHDIGLRSEDRGRGEQLPQVEGVQFAKKTPTLRNVDQRAPYMHDGSEGTLDQVVRFYNRGGDIKRTSLDIHVRPLSLSDDEIKALCAFMHTLTSPDPAVTLPVLPK
ncbi:MAG: cytochrome c peroxidase [Verrucomicrobiota bacterium]